MPLLKANDFWRPNTYYYATERYKSLIANNNTLYICNESHLSQDEFDVSKFVGISGSGGNVDLSNRYAGEWDLNANGSSYLVEAFPDPTKSTGYLTVSNDIFQYVGDSTPRTLGTTFYDYVVAEGTSTINSGIRSMKVNVPPFIDGNNIVAFGVLNNDNAVSDLFGIFGNTPSTVSGTVFLLGYNTSVGTTLTTYVFNNGELDVENIHNIIITDAVVGEPVYFNLNTETGAMEFSITGSPDRLSIDTGGNGSFIPVTGNSITIPAIFDLSNFTTDTFAPYYGVLFESANDIAQYIPELTFDLGTTDDNKLPFLSVIQEIEPPVNATDGEIYKIVGNGTYLDNPPLFNGDYVEFSESIQKLIITRQTKTESQLNNFILDVISVQSETSGIIDNAIKSKTYGTEILTLGDGDVVTIQPNTFYVEIAATDNSTLILPALNTQYTGKRLLIYSSASGTLDITYWDGLIDSVTVGDVFEFVAVNSQQTISKWLRVK